jgi:hypothetical protein
MTPKTLSKIQAAAMPMADEAAFVAMHEGLARRAFRMSFNAAQYAELARREGDKLTEACWNDAAEKENDKGELSLSLILTAKTGGL